MRKKLQRTMPEKPETRKYDIDQILYSIPSRNVVHPSKKCKKKLNEEEEITILKEETKNYSSLEEKNNVLLADPLFCKVANISLNKKDDDSQVFQSRKMIDTTNIFDVYFEKSDALTQTSPQLK